MAYKLKPNYHFANVNELGIDKVPDGRFIIIEDYGNLHEVKWCRKVTNNLIDTNNNIIGVLGPLHTINDALSYRCINSPIDEKLDAALSYSQTEVDSLLSTKSDKTTTYTKVQTDSTFRKIDDSYSLTAVDSIADGIRRNDSGIYVHGYAINQSFTIESGRHGMSVSPVILGDNVVISIADDSVWAFI